MSDTDIANMSRHPDLDAHQPAGTKLNETDILDTVERLLDEHQPQNYKIMLSRDGIRHDGDWWYLVVHPTQEDVRASEYTRKLEEIENEIARVFGLNVLLVPTIED